PPEVTRETPRPHTIPAQRLPSSGSAASEETNFAVRLAVASAIRLPLESMRINPFANEETQAVPSPGATIPETRSSSRCEGITYTIGSLRVGSHSGTWSGQRSQRFAIPPLAGDCSVLSAAAEKPPSEALRKSVVRLEPPTQRSWLAGSTPSPK